MASAQLPIAGPAPAHQQGAQTNDDAIRGPKIGSTLPTAIQNHDLLSHQNGFGNNGTETTGSIKPDNDDDGMQKKSENVANAQDRIRQ